VKSPQPGDEVTTTTGADIKQLEQTNVGDPRAWLGAFFGAVLASGALVAVAAAQTGPLLPAPPPKARAAPPAAAAPRPPLPLTGPPPRAPADAATPSPPSAQQQPAQPAKPGAAIALDVKQRALVDRVSAYLSNLRTLVGEFYQVAPDGSRSEGEFYLQKPGRVRFDYTPPSPTELVADGKSVVVRDRNLATQDLYPLSQTPLRFLLADRIDLLRDVHLVAVYNDDIFVTVVIEERQIISGTYRLMLMFGARDTQLKQWTVTDPQGQDTTVAVYNLDPNTQPDPDMFRIDYTRYQR
jgi:outer membrane lipoprotein-sorting protein